MFQFAYRADRRKQLPDMPPGKSACPGIALFTCYGLDFVGLSFLFRMADWIFCVYNSGTSIYLLKGGWFPVFRR